MPDHTPTSPSAESPSPVKTVHHSPKKTAPNPPMKSTLPCLAIRALLALLPAQAAVLVDFKMTADGQGLASSLSVSPTTTTANVTVSGLLNQAGHATTYRNHCNGGTDRVSIWTTALGSNGDVSFANAVALGNYVTFSITADAGFNITLDSISFQVAAAT